MFGELIVTRIRDDKNQIKLFGSDTTFCVVASPDRVVSVSVGDHISYEIVNETTGNFVKVIDGKN